MFYLIKHCNIDVINRKSWMSADHGDEFRP